MVVPQYVVQRDARNFPRPLEFLPERWLEKEQGLIVDDRAFFPFAIGKELLPKDPIDNKAYLYFKVTMHVQESN
jgi:hypothetical protein